jgi:signal transduction histidine kinase
MTTEDMTKLHKAQQACNYACGGECAANRCMAYGGIPGDVQGDGGRMTFSLAVVAAFGVLALGLGYAIRDRMTSRHRKAHRQAEKESDQRLDLVLWSTGDELWEMDMVHDTFTRTNPLRHIHLTNYEVVQAASTLRSEVFPEDRAMFDQALIAHFKGQTEYLDVSYRARTNTGYWCWLRTRGRVVERDSNGRALRMLGTTGDVTEFKEHELALEELNRDLEDRVQLRTEALNKTNQNLQHTIDELKEAQRQLVNAEKLAALGGLVAGVAHEINTPLGIGVTAASYLEQETKRLGVELEENRLTAEGLQRFRQTAMESTQLILRNLMRADKLVKSFKQVAVDQSSEAKRVIDLAVYLQEIMNSLHPTLKRTRHEVHIDCPDGLVMETYPGALYQVIVNLVLNSLLHAFAGKPEGTMSIGARRDGDQVVVTYRDDGCGMSEEVQKQIFDPFFTTKRGEGGSGLGLHIVWNLATQVLGGWISCDSKPGAGSQFELRFPVSWATPEESGRSGLSRDASPSVGNIGADSFGV